METYHTTPEQRLENAQKRVKTMKGFYTHAIVFVCVNLLIIGGNFYDAPRSWFNYHTFSTAFFWGIGLLAHGFSVFGGDFFLGKDWEERKIQEILNK